MVALLHATFSAKDVLVAVLVVVILVVNNRVTGVVETPATVVAATHAMAHAPVAVQQVLTHNFRNYEKTTY